MSLLLDALKRAEQEKLARQGRQPATPEEIPTPVYDAPKPPSAPQSLELEAVVEAPAPPASTAREREAAQAVFSAKRAGTGKGGLSFVWVAAVVIVLLAGSGLWFWYEMSRVGPIAARPSVAAPRPVTPAAAPAPPAESAKPELARSDDARTVPPVALAAAPATVTTPAIPGPPGVPGTSRARVPPSEAERMVMTLLKDSGSVAEAPLKLARTLDAPRVLPEVAQGYEALRRGDLAAAKLRYEAALAVDPLSVDAALGLATIAARTGDRATAARHYRRALELDAKNASALAGLASLADYSRPESLEAQLRSDLTRYPQSAPLHFALGNLYASQSRWSDAQGAYFEAHRFSPDDADISYNLAVSLDHLGQSRSATDFYQRALAAGRGQAAQFDRAQVQRRLAELKP